MEQTTPILTDEQWQYLNTKNKYGETSAQTEVRSRIVNRLKEEFKSLPEGKKTDRYISDIAATEEKTFIAEYNAAHAKLRWGRLRKEKVTE